ncbi:MBL fold metallo-hydrolase [Sutcliffiella horikoshii]|uniref:MBL fold metallo-hydrolase n=1 Tax=Sutcliffiella horikoshii TaxID=79883 RepID=UPI001F3A5941|nr:MBL fold metallo-hydrolase [Sutcliffiella horikoshii]
MELQLLTNNVYYFLASVNIGYVRFSESEGMLIDAGLEDQTMKKVLKMLDEKGLPLTHLFITHAHADHYGGAAYLQKNRQVYTMAPSFESLILQEPMLEPLYLFHGTNPISEWRNKFLEGKPIHVDLLVKEEGAVELGGVVFLTVALPGHSYQQFGILVSEILFAADAYFGKDIIHKHGIPYIVDAKEALETLEKIKKLPCRGAVPGHGRFETGFMETIDENIKVHHQIEAMIYSLITAETAGIAFEQLVTKACTEKGITVKSVPSYMLFRTAVTAYLTKLIQEQKAYFQIRNNQLVVESSFE